MTVELLFWNNKSKQLSLIIGYLKQFHNKYHINNIANIIKNYLIIPFGWDNNTLLPQLLLTNNNLIVTQNKRNINCPIISNIIFKSGKHSFEIKIHKFERDFDIVIGVVPYMYKPNIDTYIGNMDTGWGYCLDGTIYNVNKVICGDLYGDNIHLKIGDIIKCEVDFDDNTIAFYFNDKYQGIAFNDLNGYVKPAVSLYTIGNSVELINIQ